MCQKVTAVKPVDQSKLTNEGKNDERKKHETEKAIASAEWGQRDGKRERYTATERARVN